MAKSTGKYKANIAAIQQGDKIAQEHPLISPLSGGSLSVADESLPTGAYVKVIVDKSAYRWSINFDEELAITVAANTRIRAEPEVWAYILARIRLHIALNHLDPKHTELAWHAACWLKAEELMVNSGIGKRPKELLSLPQGLPRGDENILFQYFSENEIPKDVRRLSLGHEGQPFWVIEKSVVVSDKLQEKRQANLAKGIRLAASAAIDIAGGIRSTLQQEREKDTVLKQARSWVISEFPLLASLASSFTLIEDAEVCQTIGVDVAAISDQTQEIYFNPRVSLDLDEAKFVMTHEFLHVGLRHTVRRQGRDAWYWNIACDYVINDWLLEMQVGRPPEQLGYLYDVNLKGLSAEDVYDQIVNDLRWKRKLKKARTMNGNHVDMLEDKHSSTWFSGGGVDLDAFYRRALSEGLDLHLEKSRGLLPLGLVEEIRSLNQPPVPWDVELGQWLDQYFPPLEKRRTFSRAHRRQSATPDIIRPAWVSPDEARASRVFAAIIDTSGSMSRADLGKAVGAIASYALSRDVGFVRMIQCDASAHDYGYIEPESLLERVEVKGRGGTVLMPAVRLLEAASDFPKEGPVLVITDGDCDRLHINRNHAYLLSNGRRLGYPAKGPVFYLS